MIVYKLFVFLLVAGLVAQSTAAAQLSTPAGRSADLTPERKREALKFLTSVARETGQFNLPETRIRTRVLAADLLWEPDEREARGLFAAALEELRALIVKSNPAAGVKLRESEKSRLYARREQLAELRSELVLTLAGRDPQAAFDAYEKLKPALVDAYDPLRPTDLDTRFATSVAKRDPDKSYRLAKQQLAAEGLNYSFVSAFKDLHGQNSKLAAELARDVLALIKSVKLRTTFMREATPDTETGNSENGKSAEKPDVDFWQAASFVSVASGLNRAAARDKEKKLEPVLTAAEMRELAEILGNAFLTGRDAGEFALASVMEEITRHTPALAERIRQKLGPDKLRVLDAAVEAVTYDNARREKSIDEVRKLIDRAEPKVRDQRYSDLAYRALDEDQPEQALAIAGRINDREPYDHLFERIEAAMPLARARAGNREEVRQLLANLKTDRERIATLAELASTLVSKGESEAAKNLLDEAGRMIPALLKKMPDLDSTVKIATVYSFTEPAQSFSMIENGIGQLNDLIDSGIRVEEFYESGGIEENELHYGAMHFQLMTHVPNSSVLIKNLAAADLERTIRLADKFQRPEIRLYARLRIAAALLDPNAAEREKKEREQLSSEDEMG